MKDYLTFLNKRIAQEKEILILDDFPLTEQTLNEEEYENFHALIIQEVFDSESQPIKLKEQTGKK